VNSLTTAHANQYNEVSVRLRTNSYVRAATRALIVALTLIAVLVLATESVQAFEIDLSRRRHETSKKEGSVPTVQQKTDGDYFLDLFNPAEPKQEFVILNTEKGFVPAKVALRKGSRYTIHVVNVNEKEKNVSFILDSFSEHHATFYGKIKTFEIKPAQEGVFSYQCPETSFEGKFVVFTPDTALRGPASDKEN
jgi:hypothetical protein